MKEVKKDFHSYEGTDQGCVLVQGMVNVAAVDCDDASLKSLCGKYGVQGFPTLKVSHHNPFTTTKMPKSSTA